MPPFNTIGLITKPGDASMADTVQMLVDYLMRRGHDVLLDEQARGLFDGIDEDVHPRARIARDCDLVIVVGGDGTLLHAARDLVSSGTPLLGINRGRLGFLVDISPGEMFQRLDEILAGRYNLDQRLLLHGEIHRGNTCVLQSQAFNDIVVHVREMVRMIEFETFINGRYLNTQHADGMVVATPTGSTAYALSGGGPILHPALHAIELVPICPHTLSNRPIVIEADCCIEIVICEQNKVPALVSFDGQVNLDLQPCDRILISRHTETLRLIQPHDVDYFEILREKLRWSEQP